MDIDTFNQTVASIRQLKIESAANHPDHPWVQQYGNPYVIINHYGQMLTTFPTLEAAQRWVEMIHPVNQVQDNPIN